MNSDKLLVSISTFTRLGAGLVVNIAAARFLGPEGFGIFATSLVFSLILSLLSDFGLSTYSLRVIATEEAAVDRVIRLSLLLKLFLSVIVIVFSFAFVFFVGFTEVVSFSYIATLMGTLAGASGDLAFIGRRAIGNYSTEAKTVFWTSLLSVVIVGLSATTGRLEFVAMGYLLSKLVYFSITMLILKSEVFGAYVRFSIQDFTKTIRLSSGYAAENIMTNAVNQVDTFVISFLLDAHSVGVYQLGARIIQNVSPVAAILSTIYLPKLARQENITGMVSFEYKKITSNLFFEFSIISLMFLLLFIFVMPAASPVLFGPRYDSVIFLWPVFGALAFLRLACAPFNIILVSSGDTSARILSLLLVALLNGSLLFYFVPFLGALGAPLALCVGAYFQLLFIGFRASTATKRWRAFLGFALFSMPVAFYVIWCVKFL